MTKTTAIYLGRIGVEGTSGNHLWRKTVVELQMMNAALDVLKQRYGFEGFHLAGQSGGSKLVGGLIELRRDIACAVSGSGRLDDASAGVKPGDPTHSYFDVARNIAPLVQNRALRVMLVTDPADKYVPLAQQAGFVDKMRQAGRPVPEFNGPGDRRSPSWCGALCAARRGRLHSRQVRCGDRERGIDHDQAQRRVQCAPATGSRRPADHCGGRGAQEPCPLESRPLICTLPAPFSASANRPYCASDAA